MTMTPTKQQMQTCSHYMFKNMRRLWQHRCAYNNLPCKLLFKTHCPDYQPKEKKDNGNN